MIIKNSLPFRYRLLNMDIISFIIYPFAMVYMKNYKNKRNTRKSNIGVVYIRFSITEWPFHHKLDAIDKK